MRVLMITDTVQLSGAEEAMLNLARLLSAQNEVELRLVSTRFNGSTIPPLPFENSLIFRGAQPRDIESFYSIMADPRNLWKWVKEVRRVAKDFKPDLIHSGILFSIVPSVIVARDMGIPNIAHIHDYRSLSLTDLPFLKGSIVPLSISKELGYYRQVSSGRRALFGIGLRRVLKLLLDRSNLILTVSEFHKRALSPFLRPPIRVLRNVGYTFAEPGHQKKMKAVSNTVLFGGRLSVAKGFPIFLKAAAELLASENVAIDIAGGGELSDAAKRFAAANEKVHYHGLLPVDEFHQLVASSELTVHPSLSPEPCPMSVIASILLNTPAIASNRGGLTELLPQRCLFEPNVENVVKKVRDFFAKPEDYAPKLQVDVAPAAIAAQILATYYELLGKARS